jgi:myo-inositol 2-dehydrogenase / D-chiro-inositol 1-dehydrogenase
MRRRSIGIGVIGCGRIAALRHLPVLAAVEGAEAVAVADHDEARAREVAERFAVARRYRSHEELLSDPRVEAVVVCVPAAQHAEVARDALGAGKHVLLEKPVALDLADADRLLERAAAGDTRVLVGFNLRWHRLVRRARTLIAAGALGEPEALVTVFASDFAYRDTAGPWRFSRAAGGGALIEMASHHFDLWGHLLGDEVVEAAAQVRCEPGEDDVTATANGRTRRGTLLASTISQRSVQAQEVDVLGTAARLRLSLYRFDSLEVVPVRRRPGRLASRAGAAARLFRELPAGVRSARRGGDFVDSYRLEWGHFLATVRGEAEPECTLEDGRRALAVMTAVLQGAEEGRAVRVESAPVAPAPEARA